MSLLKQVEALAHLKPGWNDDPAHPAPAVNAETVEFAIYLIKTSRILDHKWKAGPLPDGSIRFSGAKPGQLLSITVGALKT